MNKPMSSLAQECFALANAMAKVAVLTHPAVGSPEALADCHARLHEAKRAANRELFRQLRAEEPLTIDDVDETPSYETGSEQDETR